MRSTLPLWLFLLGSCSTERPVVVGSKNFSEQVILGEMVAELLELRGIPVDRRLNLGGSFICHRALLSGDMDVYVEYTGTALTAILKESVSHDPDEVYRRVRDAYRSRFGLEWGAPLGFNNTFVMTMRADHARRLGIRTISDLKAHQDTLRPGSGHEFLEREDGLPGLLRAYALDFEAPPRGIELGLVFQALVSDQVDVVAGNSTDGRIEKFGLTVLEDDRRFFPPYHAAAVYRPEIVEQYPAFVEVMELLEGAIDQASMGRLNYRVDVEGVRVVEVVREFLAEKGWGE